MLFVFWHADWMNFTHLVRTNEDPRTCWSIGEHSCPVLAQLLWLIMMWCLFKSDLNISGLILLTIRLIPPLNSDYPIINQQLYSQTFDFSTCWAGVGAVVRAIHCILKKLGGGVFFKAWLYSQTDAYTDSCGCHRCRVVLFHLEDVFYTCALDRYATTCSGVAARTCQHSDNKLLACERPHRVYAYTLWWKHLCYMDPSGYGLWCFFPPTSPPRQHGSGYV